MPTLHLASGACRQNLLVLKLMIAILDELHSQGRSQRGVQGVQLNPPSKLMIFMTNIYALEKLGAKMYVLYNTPTFYANSTHT